MDLSFTADDIAFRDQVRGFIAEAFDDELRQAVADSRNGYLPRELQLRWQQSQWRIPRLPRMVPMR